MVCKAFYSLDIYRNKSLTPNLATNKEVHTLEHYFLVVVAVSEKSLYTALSLGD